MDFALPNWYKHFRTVLNSIRSREEQRFEILHHTNYCFEREKNMKKEKNKENKVKKSGKKNKQNLSKIMKF